MSSFWCLVYLSCFIILQTRFAYWCFGKYVFPLSLVMECKIFYHLLGIVQPPHQVQCNHVHWGLFWFFMPLLFIFTFYSSCICLWETKFTSQMCKSIEAMDTRAELNSQEWDSSKGCSVELRPCSGLGDFGGIFWQKTVVRLHKQVQTACL